MKNELGKQDNVHHKGKSQELPQSSAPNADDIRQLALAMSELASSLHDFVTYLHNNPEISQIPDSIRELTKRISVLSTRL